MLIWIFAIFGIFTAAVAAVVRSELKRLVANDKNVAQVISTRLTFWAALFIIMAASTEVAVCFVVNVLLVNPKLRLERSIFSTQDLDSLERWVFATSLPCLLFVAPYLYLARCVFPGSSRSSVLAVILLVALGLVDGIALNPLYCIASIITVACLFSFLDLLLSYVGSTRIKE